MHFILETLHVALGLKAAESMQGENKVKKVQDKLEFNTGEVPGLGAEESQVERKQDKFKEIFDLEPIVDPLLPSQGCAVMRGF